MWRRLLSKSRIDEECERLKSIQAQLPPYVAAIISRHLQEWAMGEALHYENQELVARSESESDGVLQEKDEVGLQKALKDQIKRWKRMVFGVWEPITFLPLAERRWIERVSNTYLAVSILVACAFYLAVLGGLAYLLDVYFVPMLLAFFQNQQAGVSDWLALATLFWAVLIALPLPFALRLTRQLIVSTHLRLRDWLIVRYVSPRTLVRWNKYL